MTVKPILVMLLATSLAAQTTPSPSKNSSKKSAPPPAAPVVTVPPRRIFIDERTRTVTDKQVTRTRSTSLELGVEFQQECPELLTVTSKPEAADYTLALSPGNSSLYRQNGDMVYFSPARFSLHNIAKDVCNFVYAHWNDTQAPPPGISDPAQGPAKPGPQ
jgi:hypothetical protein